MKQIKVKKNAVELIKLTKYIVSGFIEGKRVELVLYTKENLLQMF